MTRAQKETQTQHIDIDPLVDLTIVATMLGISHGAAARRRDRGQLPPPLRREVSGRSDKWLLSTLQEFISSGGANAVGKAKKGRRGRPPLPVIPDRQRRKRKHEEVAS